MSARTDKFNKEFRALLKKHKAEMEIEDMGNGYYPDDKIVVDFSHISEEEPYEQIVYGRYI